MSYVLTAVLACVATAILIAAAQNSTATPRMAGMPMPQFDSGLNLEKRYHILCEGIGVSKPDTEPDDEFGELASSKGGHSERLQFFDSRILGTTQSKNELAGWGPWLLIEARDGRKTLIRPVHIIALIEARPESKAPIGEIG